MDRKRLGLLFEQALELSPEARTTFLDDVCADDEALRQELESLLKAHDAAPAFFEDLAEAVVDPSLAGLEDAPSPVEQWIGPYRLVRALGQGGMGTVYLAEREDVGKRVALKLVRTGLAAPDHIERFLLERRVLARLSHPNVAQLFDAGVTEGDAAAPEGTPYFAMEYVEGAPITAYCDHHQLSIEDRLHLFKTVCKAVHHAHRNLIVHRDLKPSNIMVAAPGESEGGLGQVKLLDFGIAKLLEDDAPGVTRTGRNAFTPAYAAPEQIRGEAVTTATDVYSLGVLLYELITGHRPYKIKGQPLSEVERLVCQTQPSWPSDAVTRTETIARPDGSTEVISPEQISRTRRISVDRLHRRLKGDLDNIVMMALRKEPERRYASAEAFLEDIERHLSGVPVTARPSTIGYRIRKFAQRHRVGVAMGSVALAMLIGFAVLYTARITTEKNRAQQAAREAEQVTAILAGLFEAADPWKESHGEPLTARALLDRGVREVQTSLAEQPGVQATMMTLLGDVYRKLGDLTQAESLLTEALTMRRGLYDATHADVAHGLMQLGFLYRDKGDYGAAEQQFREALRHRLRTGTALDVAEAQSELGVTLYYNGGYEEAEKLIREALATRRAHLTPPHANLANSTHSLALVLLEIQKFEEAETLLQEALAQEKQLQGEVHPDLASVYNSLGLLNGYQERYDQAEPYYRKAIEIWDAVLGPAHPELALGLSNLGVMYSVKGDFAKADSVLRKTLTMRRQLHEADDLPVAESIDNLAHLYYYQGEWDQAEPLFREVSDMHQRLGYVTNHSSAMVQFRLGQILVKKDNPSEAIPYFRKTVSIWREVFGESHPYVGIGLNQLGWCLTQQRAFAVAETTLKEAEATFEQAGADYATQLDSVRNNLGRLYEARGDNR